MESLQATEPALGPSAPLVEVGDAPLSVLLTAPGHPPCAQLTLPRSVSPRSAGTEWTLIRVPIQELLQRLAKWSDVSFPNLHKLSAVLAAIDNGETLEMPVLVRHQVGHVFESGGHVALMLAQLGATYLPVVVRNEASKQRPPKIDSLRSRLCAWLAQSLSAVSRR